MGADASVNSLVKHNLAMLVSADIFAYVLLVKSAPIESIVSFGRSMADPFIGS